MGAVRFLAGFVFLAISIPVLAQPVTRHLDSVAWLVADSDLVVVGRIASSKPIGPAQWPQLQLLTVHVSQTLKGSSQQDLKFVVNLPDYPRGTLGRIIQGRNEALMFLRRSARTPPGGMIGHLERYFLREPYAPRSLFDTGWILNLDPTADIQSTTIDLEPLRGAQSLIAEAKKAVQEEPKGGRTYSHDFVFDPRKLSGLLLDNNGGMGLSVSVPIDSRLERVAQAWAVSTDAHNRQSAVEALVYFRSEKNIAILRSLLNDPFEPVSVPPGTARHFPIRQAAQWLLDAWGVPWS